MPVNAYHLREGLRKHLKKAELAKLGETPIGIAGAGGLGSNVAMLLARSGIEQLTLVDYDSVEKSNLNRQHYWPRHLQMSKVSALAESLIELNPGMRLTLVEKRLEQANLPELLSTCPIWVEALDNANTKADFIEKALLLKRHVVGASGICGIGGEPMKIKRLGRLVLVGDFQTSSDTEPPMAPRVMQAAALMADIVLAWVLGLDNPKSF